MLATKPRRIGVRTPRRKQRHPIRVTSISLRTDQLAMIKQLGVEVGFFGGSYQLGVSQFLRGVIDALDRSGVNFSGCVNEDQVREHLLACLAAGNVDDPTE